MDNSTKRHFSFVNLKHPDDLKDEETQLRIRRLAMTEVGRARRKPKSNKSRNEIILEFRGSTLDQSNLERFGAGQLDPFYSYPIPVNDAIRALIANSWFPSLRYKRDY